MESQKPIRGGTQSRFELSGCFFFPIFFIFFLCYCYVKLCRVVDRPFFVWCFLDLQETSSGCRWHTASRTPSSSTQALPSLALWRSCAYGLQTKVVVLWLRDAIIVVSTLATISCTTQHQLSNSGRRTLPSSSLLQSLGTWIRTPDTRSNCHAKEFPCDSKHHWPPSYQVVLELVSTLQQIQ